MRHACIAGVVLFFSLSALGHDDESHEVAGEMAGAAQRFVATLSDEQKSRTLFAFDSDKRRDWHFVPDRSIKEQDGKRFGLPIGKMTQQQRLLAHALLSTGLSHEGYRQATTIMALETVLRELENNNPIRDPELYYVSIFGEPRADKTWGWRFEGHHLSINFTLVDGDHFAVTPSFFGSNPARVPSGPLKDLRIVGEEEDLARKLVKSLSEDQRKKALIAETAPEDVITGQERKVNKGLFFPPQGVAFDDLQPEQRELLGKVVGRFARKYRPEVLDQLLERGGEADDETMHFAWAGGLEAGQPHYFRVQTARWLFEYDNTQNDANHAHAVWRDFDGDFGEDLLREHYEKSHPQP